MLIAVGSVKASPGVSTFCLALAARWPTSARRVVVECDPAGGDLAARYGLGVSPGLVSLAADAHNADGIGVVWRHVQVLPGGLPVVVAPPGAEQTRGALIRLAPVTLTSSSRVEEERSENEGRSVLDPDAVIAELVVADCGRLDPGSPAIRIASHAELLLLLVRPQADELAHLAHRVDEIRSWAPRPRLLLAGRGYSAAEVAREVGIAVMATVPDDPVAAAAMTGQQPGTRHRWSRSTHALSDAATRIATLLTEGKETISAHRSIDEPFTLRRPSATARDQESVLPVSTPDGRSGVGVR